MPDYAFIGAAVGICGFIVALVTLLMRGRDDSNSHAKFDATISTKLDFMSEDLKDIKADQRTYQRELSDVRGIAYEAKSRAEAAHKRLDAAGIGKEGMD